MNEFVYIKVEFASGKIDMFYVHESSVKDALDHFTAKNYPWNPVVKVTVIRKGLQ